jgi:hypothetical protein
MRMICGSAVVGLALVITAARADESSAPTPSPILPTEPGSFVGPPAPDVAGLWNAPSPHSVLMIGDVGMVGSYSMMTPSTVFTTVSSGYTTAPRTGIVDTVTTPKSSGSHLNVLPGSHRP